MTSASEQSGRKGPAAPQETAEDLYEHAPCGHLSTLPDGTIIRVNATLLSWLGYDRDELVGRRFVDLLAAGGRLYHETHYAPLLSMQGKAGGIALEMVRADGRRLPVLVTSILQRTPDGTPRVIRTGVFDATDRREYEQELMRARQRAEHSEARARALAQTLQASFVPPSPPHIPGLHVTGAYRSAGTGDEVGGDFYDVFQTGEDDWAVVLGDVAGKGAAAAAVTALARYTVRGVATRTRRPRSVLAALNAALLGHSTERFCTVVYLRVHRDADGRIAVTVSSGGHALPILVTPDDVRPVGRPGTVLGVFEDAELHDTTFILEPGAALFCYTDGLTEGRRGDEFYGYERLAAALAALRGRPGTDVAQTIVDEIVAFQHGHPRDDMAAVHLAVPPQP